MQLYNIIICRLETQSLVSAIVCSMLLFTAYVSYTDVEIKLEPSDEEFTDCEGKLKIHIKYTKYISVLLIASSNVSIKMGQQISNFPVSSFFIQSFTCYFYLLIFFSSRSTTNIFHQYIIATVSRLCLQIIRHCYI